MSEFPSASSKMNAPVKKSIFERQKEEAEAKRIKEQAETAAVLEEFTKSFDDGGRPSIPLQRALPSGPGKRHFTSSGLKSGPGSLGPSPAHRSGPGSLGPAFGRKRQYDDYNDGRDKGGASLYKDDRKTSFDNDTEEKAAAKPTVQLSSLPPATSPAVIKSLLSSSPLVVESVRILPTSAPVGSSTERRAASAIVTLAADTPAADIDAVVSQLQNKYLGLGFNLSISRHLSSAALANVNISTGSTNDLPFGAKSIQQHQSLSRAPPPNHRFAPPGSYTSSTPYPRSSTQVTVQPPSDLNQLKLIHKMLEALLTYGPEFEALLMSRPEIQKDEKWAWLWNSRSAGGIYYRWRLWEILTDGKSRRKHGRQGNEALFEGQSIWQPPDETLRFEYTTQLDEFVSDEDYNSSDEEEDEGGIANRYNDHNAPGTNPEDINDGKGYLNPLARAKLVHLLSRLPDSIAKVRRGDIARITAFAIEHAGAGSSEIAMLIARNVIKPFNGGEEDDKTPSSHVGLYVISDILSSSASAGVRHAWRYRNLFENALRQQHVWEKLGRAEKDLSWGKLKAEKWKRSIQSLLSLWEGWSVFPQASHEEFTDSFLNPPLTAKERAQTEAEEKRKTDEEAKRIKSVNRWRSVEDEQPVASDIDMTDVDGVAMNNRGDVGEILDDDIDGVPMEDSSDEEGPGLAVSPPYVDAKPEPEPDPPKAEKPKLDPPVTGKRQRPRAADMFADDSA